VATIALLDTEKDLTGMKQLHMAERRIPVADRNRLITLSRLGCLCAILLLTQTACTIPLLTPNSQITGTVYGDSVPLQEQGISKAVPLAGATVRCGNVSTKTDQDGRYTLSLAPQPTYNCTASAPLHQSQNDQVDLAQGSALILNFGPRAETVCSGTSGKSPHQTESCGLLPLASGSLSGTVLSDGSNLPVNNAEVTCVLIDPAALASPIDSSDGMTEMTGTDGSFNFASLAVGPYSCLTFTGGVTKGRQTVSIAPDATSTTTIKSCSQDCPPVTYHGGPVMRAMSAYLIFWLPGGYTFDPGGSDSFYESLIQRFFQDLQGTGYYRLLTQYWDYQGSIKDQVALGGAYVDTTPYQHCSYSGLYCTHSAASRNDPLYDIDIQGEISRALKANPSWSTAQTHEFFVFTGNGAQECSTNSSTRNCTYTPYPGGFCGYHSEFFDDGSEVNPGDGTSPAIYAYVPAPAATSPNSGCAPQDLNLSGVAGHGDGTPDMAVNFVSHEMFESITDPLFNTLGTPTSGWFNDAVDAKTAGLGEIGDLCTSDFGQLGADGGNVSLLHGDRYVVQAEWNNITGSCSLG
jgi:hypothetical protein